MGKDDRYPLFSAFFGLKGTSWPNAVTLCLVFETSFEGLSIDCGGGSSKRGMFLCAPVPFCVTKCATFQGFLSTSVGDENQSEFAFTCSQIAIKSLLGFTSTIGKARVSTFLDRRGSRAYPRSHTAPRSSSSQVNRNIAGVGAVIDDMLVSPAERTRSSRKM